MAYISWTQRQNVPVERLSDGLYLSPHMPGEGLAYRDPRLRSTQALIGERYETTVNVHVAVYECTGSHGGSGPAVGWETNELLAVLREMTRRIEEDLKLEQQS